LKVRGEPLVPCPRSLLEAVEGSLQKTHMIGASGVNKARRLLTVDGLLQVAVKKGVLHIQLVDRPATRGGDAEDDTNRRRLDNGAEGHIVVDVVALSEATNDPASLVTGKRTVGVEFMLINPLASHNVHARWSWDETPGVVVDEGLVLVRHGSEPLGVGECAPVVPRDRRNSRGDEGDLCRGRRWRRRRREAEPVDRLERASLLPSDWPAGGRERLDWRCGQPREVVPCTPAVDPAKGS